jgi:glycine oxidase
MLTALSDRLHWQWAEELRTETGIDNGLRRCGGLYFAPPGVSPAAHREEAEAWRRRGATVHWVDGPVVAMAEPALAEAVAAGRLAGGFLLPDEARIRPPWHLEALEQSCRRRGVTFAEGSVAERIEVSASQVSAVRIQTPQGHGVVRADCFVLAAGAWSGGLASQCGLELDTRPIRGQIALLRYPRQWLRQVVNRGFDYLVPREDGRVLVGSTLEDVGFQPAVTSGGSAALLDMARELLGNLDSAVVERTWAGLRPGSSDGRPTIGPVPGYDNAFVATGHYRAGIHQSPGTAVVVADLVEGRSPPFDLAAWAADRRGGASALPQATGLV